MLSLQEEEKYALKLFVKILKLQQETRDTSYSYPMSDFLVEHKQTSEFYILDNQIFCLVNSFNPFQNKKQLQVLEEVFKSDTDFRKISFNVAGDQPWTTLTYYDDDGNCIINCNGVVDDYEYNKCWAIYYYYGGFEAAKEL